jgi:hypothetical protein
VKTPERERARACPLRVGKAAIRRFLALVVVFALLVGESGTATQPQLDCKVRSGLVWSGQVGQVRPSGAPLSWRDPGVLAERLVHGLPD